MSYLQSDWFSAFILSVYSMCFYQIWRIAENTKTSQSFGSKLESLCTTGMIYTIFLTFTAWITFFVYDLAAIITFVVLDWFTVVISEVRLHYEDMHSLSNRPSKSFKT